jgi:hypothetical protein
MEIWRNTEIWRKTGKTIVFITDDITEAVPLVVMLPLFNYLELERSRRARRRLSATSTFNADLQRVSPAVHGRGIYEDRGEGEEPGQGANHREHEFRRYRT